MVMDITRVDWNGIAVVIGALGAFIGTVVNVILNWKAKNVHDKDKQEAIAAREEQNVILKQVHVVTNSAKNELERQGVELKDEIARVAVPGAHPTPEGPAGSPGVSIDKGIVSVGGPITEEEPPHD